MAYKQSRAAAQKRVKSGNIGEKVAELKLRQAGFKCIEKIETGWSPQRRGGRVVGAFPRKKVAADFWAIEPVSGRAVRVEVKSTAEGTLSLSRFEDHQLYNLDQMAKHNGISLVAWVHGGDCVLLSWPISGFQKGSPLKWGEVCGSVGKRGCDYGVFLY